MFAFLKSNNVNLFEACCSGKIDRVQKYINRVGVNVNFLHPEYDGCTMLYMALVRNYVEIVKLLLTKEPDLNIKGMSRGFTALHVTISPEIAQLLISAGAHINAQTTEHGMTPLYYAAQEGHLGVVKVLLAAGADVSIKETTYGGNARDAAQSNEIMKALYEDIAHVQTVDLTMFVYIV